jgi:hypothetical protein
MLNSQQGRHRESWNPFARHCSPFRAQGYRTKPVFLLLNAPPLPWDLTKLLYQSKPVQICTSKAKHQEFERRTAEHDVTRPRISIPASARAVVAAMDPAATQPSMPSVSMTVRKMSTVDFGSVSRRTDAIIA